MEGGGTTTCWICNGDCSMGLLSVVSVCVMIAFPMLNYFQHLCHICCLVCLYSGLLSLSVKGAFIFLSARDPKISSCTENSSLLFTTFTTTKANG